MSKENGEQFKINDQTIDIYNNLIKYYNSCNEIKSNIDESKKEDKIKKFYLAIKNDSKLNGYLLKRNKLLFYKNKNTEIINKINLYAVLKEEDREEVLEKFWDNLTLLYLSIEETATNKDENLFGNLTKSMEAGSLGKLFNNLEDEIKNMNVNGMFEKLKSQATPEAKTKANNLLTSMISKLTDNMGDISKSGDPTKALMDNLQSLAKDYSKQFESGELDFASFLSAVPDILNNPEEITKSIDVSKLNGIELPDISNLLDKSKGGEMGELFGNLGQLNGKLGDSLNSILGGNFDDMMSKLIEKQGVDLLDKAVKDAEAKQNMKPLTEEQIKELEEYLKNDKLGLD